MHPAVESYLSKDFARNAQYDRRKKCFVAPIQGRMTKHCGLIKKIGSRHMPGYGDKQSKRRHGSTNVIGSSSKLGTRVDKELVLECGIKPRKKKHILTKTLLDYWTNAGHKLVTAQLPVIVRDFSTCMTQADIITMDRNNHLWLWEVKTGMPVGFHLKKGFLHHVDGEPVPCTGMEKWQLQLIYTQRAVCNAGIPIRHARVIQVHEQRNGPVVVKVHEPPRWIERIRFP